MVPVLRSCQSPIRIWLVNYLHLHLHLHARTIPERAAQPKSMRVQECCPGRRSTLPGLRSRCTHPLPCSCASLSVSRHRAYIHARTGIQPRTICRDELFTTRQCGYSIACATQMVFMQRCQQTMMNSGLKLSYDTKPLNISVVVRRSRLTLSHFDRMSHVPGGAHQGWC